MSLRLAKLQKSDAKTRKITLKNLGKYKNIDRMFYNHKLLFVPEIISKKLIN